MHAEACLFLLAVLSHAAFVVLTGCASWFLLWCPTEDEFPELMVVGNPDDITPRQALLAVR